MLVIGSDNFEVVMFLDNFVVLYCFCIDELVVVNCVKDGWRVVFV